MITRKEFMQSSGVVAAGLLGGTLPALASTATATDKRAAAVYFASGARVGEVSQNAAIVWTRLTAEPERRWNGVVPMPLMSPTRVMSPSPDIPPTAWEGAVPGIAGDLRVLIAETPDLAKGVRSTGWEAVGPDTDFSHNFAITGLQPATRYYYAVEGRAAPEAAVARSAVGTFRTPPAADQWEEFWFSVITCQLYYQRDEREGFRIYRSMANLSPIYLGYPDFIVRTGDNVYYDRDNPRGNTIPLCRLHWQRMYSLPMIVDFLRQVPSYWQKDDHDAYFDDSYPGLFAPWIAPLTFADGAKVFREQAPVGDMLYRTFRWGKGVQVWLTENRDFRSPDEIPDSATKTIWGDKQKEWLKRSLLESDAAFKILLSPTAIVGPDNADQADSHADNAFKTEGEAFREWVRTSGLTNFFVIAGDRHWQYASTDPRSGLHEFACGPTSDAMVLKGPGYDPNYHAYYREGGGFVSIGFRKGSKKVLANPQRVVVEDGAPILTIRIHDVDGGVKYEYRAVAKG